MDKRAGEDLEIPANAPGADAGGGFAGTEKRPRRQGATAASIVRRLKDAGIGCRYYSSTGNEVDLGMEDHLSYVLQDPEVEIVVGFVESIRRPAAFLAVADLADRVQVLDYGKTISVGTPTAVLADQHVINAYLGVPD